MQRLLPWARALGALVLSTSALTSPACAAPLLGAQQDAATSATEPETDLRTLFDVEAYELELAVRPSTTTLEGVATVRATALAEVVDRVQLDLYDLHEVLEVRQGEEPIEFERIEQGLIAKLARPAQPGEAFDVTVHYRGQPEGKGFDGFHWETSEDGSPWINTSCQGLGAHYWYPCKASYFHPEDKPARVSMAIVCPAELYGVSNGRLVETVDAAPEWFATKGEDYKTYRWRHDYPLETYSVTLNVGPYVVVETELQLEGLDQKVPFVYYVLPESVEKAKVQFTQVPELLRIYTEAFGPWPFPGSKFGLVETNFWGMEHSTAVAYGSSYPLWCEQQGEPDRYANRNRWFDYILVHEVAHEWWGNAVSAEHWGHFWIHEGLGTYAEGVYVEKTRSRADADRYFVEQARRISTRKGRLYRGDKPASGDAYSGLIYSKGACVMNTLRHYVDDDDAWWGTLSAFNVRYRYENATTEDFCKVLEERTGADWERFFTEWVYGEGTPALEITVGAPEGQVQVEVDNTNGTFHAPLDVAWDEGGETKRQRLWVEPGKHTLSVTQSGSATNARIEHLDRLLGKHEVNGEAVPPKPAR